MAQLGAPRRVDALTLDEIRAEIDSVDDRIIALLRERASLSQQAQRTRMDAGGVRLDLTREREIFARYRDQLGFIGVEVVGAVMRLCRGPISLQREEARGGGV